VAYGKRAWQGEELALLDLRSVEAFAKGHPLFATNLPVANLERDALRFVPRKSVRLVLSTVVTTRP
jgi:rhodanese-related sulfurtransferase